MPEDGVFGEIMIALRRAFADLDYPGFEEFKYEEIGSELRFAFHCGEAGGIAAAAGLFGLKALELCDDISDAWEDYDNDFLLHILNELIERPNQNDQTYARVRDAGIDWDARGAALDDAVRSVKKVDWRGNRFKEREVRNAIRSVLGDDDSLVNTFFEIVKARHDY